MSAPTRVRSPVLWDTTKRLCVSLTRTNGAEDCKRASPHTVATSLSGTSARGGETGPGGGAETVELAFANNTTSPGLGQQSLDGADFVGNIAGADNGTRPANDAVLRRPSPLIRHVHHPAGQQTVISKTTFDFDS